MEQGHGRQVSEQGHAKSMQEAWGKESGARLWHDHATGAHHYGTSVMYYTYHSEDASHVWIHMHACASLRILLEIAAMQHSIRCYLPLRA